jgi:flagellar protein FliS
MEKEKKQEFTRRITSSNRGQMIVVIYDIYFAYQQEALEAWEAQDLEGFKESLRKAQEAVKVLQNGLDFHYPIAKELYPLYQYVNRQLSTCFYKRSTEGIRAAEKVMKGLYSSFVEVAKQDTSKPLMKHTQQIVAGMTYQKGSLTETVQGLEGSRGFLA